MRRVFASDPQSLDERVQSLSIPKDKCYSRVPLLLLMTILYLLELLVYFYPPAPPFFIRIVLCVEPYHGCVFRTTPCSP